MEALFDFNITLPNMMVKFLFLIVGYDEDSEGGDIDGLKCRFLGLWLLALEKMSISQGLN